jgi:hypothetical protein
MKDPEAVVTRAIKVSPGQLRERYAPEWTTDLAAAESPKQRHDVAQAALALAWSLRRQWLARALLLRSGWTSAGVWLAFVLIIGALAFLPLFPLTFVAVLALVVAMLISVGRPTHATRAILLTSVILGVAATAYVAWSFAAGVDAADAGTQAPTASRWTGAGLIVILLCAIAFVVAAIYQARHGRSPAGPGLRSHVPDQSAR